MAGYTNFSFDIKKKKSARKKLGGGKPETDKKEKDNGIDFFPSFSGPLFANSQKRKKVSIPSRETSIWAKIKWPVLCGRCCRVTRCGFAKKSPKR
jgi:hypothetical protein